MNEPVALTERKRTPETAAATGCIHEQFEAQAAATPDAIALSHHAEQWTYGELNRRASQLAHHLRRCGVGPEIPVALCLDRSLEMVLAILAVLKAGGLYVPIDLAYPPERRRFMLEDTQAPLLLTRERLRQSAPPGPARVLCLDSEWDAIAAQPDVSPVNLARGDNAAYIIFTSGSTGKPKGVVVTHHNVVRLFGSTKHWYGFHSGDVWPLFHSYAFDVSVWELWGALFHGGRLVIVPYLVSRAPGLFYELLAREQVTVLNQTPSAFRQLIRAEIAAEKQLPLALRYVICAGEALELQSLKPWFDRHGDERPVVVNMYGITETTVHAMFRPIRLRDLTRLNGSVIGEPIPDLQIHLLDDQLRPVPRGEPGEICVGGAGVARGYFGRPELTAQKFVPDPFSEIPGARLYRSGDLAKQPPGGEMEYLGRIDHQVKIRGFRVELGEVESVLNRHPGVRESAVLARETASGDNRLAAYVVPSAAPPPVTALREHLGRHLPEYMIPALFTFLDALPLTTNGKLDRRALPDPDRARPALEREYVAPRNERERILARVWSEVLEIEKVGVNDRFFELGGDSIRSITLLSRARQAGLRLSLAQLFQNPTVAALAAEARENAPDGAPPMRTGPFELIAPQDRARLGPEIEDAYPLTRLQLGMFYHNELNPASAMYHDVFSYRVPAAFDRPLLELAIQRLAERHPALRTSFNLADYSEPLQLVHRRVTVPCTAEDLRGLDAAQQRQRIVAWVDAERRNAFDRALPPLIRFHSQWLGPGTFQFIVSFHHVCVDGWSLAAIVTEVLSDYAALRSGIDRPPPAPQIGYREFVALERQAVSSVEHRRFWAERIAEYNAPMLPRWPKAMRTGGEEQMRGPEVQIEPDVLGKLRQLAQAGGVPLRTVLLAAHQRVMSLLYGQTDVCTGLVVNGRPENEDGERLIGLFLNTAPLRQRLEGGSWRELIRQTFAAEQELLPYRRFPIAEVNKTAGRTLFETAFDFVHFHVLRNLGGAGVPVEEGHYFEANDLTTYTTFMLDPGGTRLQMKIDYDPDALCRRQVEQMTAYYVRTLAAMAQDPEAPYDRFSPLSEAELQQFLGWNQTAADYPPTQCLHELIEMRVRETPHALAVRFHEHALTYRELNERADRFAARLAVGGVRPETLVGICLERCLEMPVALLGILKAGAAYVPLDPAYPKSRLAQIIERTRLQVIVADASRAAELPAGAARILALDESGPASGAIRGNGSAGAHPPAENAAGREERFAERAPASFPARAAVSGPVCADLDGGNEIWRGTRSERLAYVMHTSGSTGVPKAVAVSHRAVVNALLSIARKTNLTARDRMLAITTLSFDIAALELFLPLMTGGTVIMAPPETVGDGMQLAALLDASAATVMQGTPATWQLLLAAGWKGKVGLKILCGGEALNRKLADELLGCAAEVWNMYGPTETTIWSTAGKVARAEPISIGRPLDNTRVYILDGHLRLLPVGVAGELCIGGDGLARGYLGEPELTAQKFVCDPFGGVLPGVAEPRLYRTGDLARYLPDGTIQCLGRIDQQLKIRGFRVEPGEVESALREYPGVVEALVRAREDLHGEKRLVAYLVAPAAGPPVAALREFLRQRVPAHMVPAHFVMVNRFPLTPSGKVDARLLPGPENGCAPASPCVPARNEDEARLLEIWRDVLGFSRAGVTENFFELGGDSLSATRVFARINRAFTMGMTLGDFFEHPTVAAQAEIVRRMRGSLLGVSPRIPRRAEAGGARRAG